MFQRKGGGQRLLNNVKKNCTFLIRWLPLYNQMSRIQIPHFLRCYKYLQRRSFLFEVVKKSPIQHVTRGTWLDLTWGRSQNVASCRQLPGCWLVHYLSQLKSTFAKEMSREWSEKYLRIVCETRISEKCKLILGSNRGGNCFVLFSINLEWDLALKM